MSYVCPRCAMGLRSVWQGRRLTWVCPGCGGRAIGVAALRQATLARPVKRMWADARSPDAPYGAACPASRRPARQVRLALGEHGIQTVDVCTRCHFTWFDPREFEALPAPPGPPRRTPVRPEAAEAVAAFEERHVDVMRRLRRASLPGHVDGPPGEPDAWWKHVAGLLGMPVEFQSGPLGRVPWATYALLATVALASVLAFRDLAGAVAAAGFLPGEPLRHAGLTFVTPFFLHADWLHLVGNLYFLWVFGDDVEDRLRPLAYLGLILAATVAGNVLHMLVTDRPDVPCVGSSGGISGVIVLYALSWPHARLGVLFYFFTWIRFPAWVGLLTWIGLQAVGLGTGRGNVAYGAHLGGALVGLTWWFLARRRNGGGTQRGGSPRAASSL